MTTRVIAGPAAIATPGDVPGSHAAEDPAVIRMIAAAQRTIDGPEGWLGRALGKQTLELWLDGFSCADVVKLFGPAINVVSVKYLDPQEVEQTVDQALYRLVGDELLFRQAFEVPATACAPDAVRIQYEAGYEANAVPPEAKEAVILMAIHAKSVGAENLFLRSEEVEGIGTFQYTVSEQAGGVIKKAVESLLNGLRVVHR